MKLMVAAFLVGIGAVTSASFADDFAVTVKGVVPSKHPLEAREIWVDNRRLFLTENAQVIGLDGKKRPYKDVWKQLDEDRMKKGGFPVEVTIPGGSSIISEIKLLPRR